MKNKHVCRCIDCKHSDLMQWFNNPVIAFCRVRKERLVARALIVCRAYVKDKQIKKIKQYDKY